MSLPFAQVATTPLPSDVPVMNYGVTAIPANVAVTVDATNQMGTGTNGGMGVAVIAADGDPTCGVTVVAIPAGGQGYIRTQGDIVLTANGSITAGTYVDASGTTNKVGFAVAHGAGKAHLGIARNSCVDGEQVSVQIQLGTGA